MQNYSELIIPGLVASVEPKRVAEILSILSPDANIQLRVALYLNGTIEKRNKFAKALTKEQVKDLKLSHDSDYMDRVCEFDRYDFVNDIVYYQLKGGKVRHAFKTQEDADRWLAGEYVSNSNWRKSESYPIEVWKDNTEAHGGSCSADEWPEE